MRKNPYDETHKAMIQILLDHRRHRALIRAVKKRGNRKYKKFRSLEKIMVHHKTINLQNGRSECEEVDKKNSTMRPEYRKY